MPSPLRLVSLTVWPIRLPFRRRFTHAAAEREETCSVLVSVRGAEGQTGWGETLPRPYVTGETQSSVLATMSSVWPTVLTGFSATSFAEAVEKLEALPFQQEGGRRIHAARAAVELALLDLAAQHFLQPWADLGRMFTLSPAPVKSPKVRISGILSGGSAPNVLRQMSLQWWWGLRDFKLKVGLPQDNAVLTAIEKQWGGAIRKGAITLRADANAAWTLEEAQIHCRRLARMGLVSIEEPLRLANSEDPGVNRRQTFDDRWVELARLRLLDIMADESLVTRQDADQMIATHAAGAMNIRLSKNGGLIPALRLAQQAVANGKWVQLGCMVGETSILTAAGRVFLALVPQVRFAEGAYGPWLLHRDITAKPLKIKWGGRWQPVPGPGWGVQVDESRLRSRLNGEQITLSF